eukprot:361569-Chlamydomonas_euryale.AAC.7
MRDAHSRVLVGTLVRTCKEAGGHEREHEGGAQVLEERRIMGQRGRRRTSVGVTQAGELTAEGHGSHLSWFILAMVHTCPHRIHTCIRDEVESRDARLPPA